ncbi:hypothetical protein [Bacteroides sp. 224]|uniref:hypothetical protein n=1 Tax=Bacteroides sp. 224 TaxID=2302936 RepID=UPI0013D33A11|nr:hypothetical protein [Bacteroides sp. 224]
MKWIPIIFPLLPSGSFEEMLSNTLSIIYDHNNIRTVMLQIESFLRIMSEL